MALTFYLGTHEPSWLGRLDVPLFLARGRLARQKKLPRARAPWALDSGGFSELSLHGRWTVPAATYAAEVRRWATEVGRMDWAAIQDWMCEPAILQKTGLKVEEHQRRTVDSYEELRALAPEIPWCPVLQGWAMGDYDRHVDLYLKRGHDLWKLPVVGIGTMCRRQNTLSAQLTIMGLHREGLKLHGFGFKTQGLRGVSRQLASADSLAWSYDARRAPPYPGHTHKNCANCSEYALDWRDQLLSRIERDQDQRQLQLGGAR